MKILIVVDSPTWAIGSLTRSIQKFSPHLDLKVEFIHPRDAATQEARDRFELAAENADVIHFQYWRTASQLHEAFPDLLKSKRTILTHHNQKNLLSEDWSWVDLLCCHTKKAQDILRTAYPKEKIRIIRHGIDFDLFTYNENYPPKEELIGYVGRIVPWKGLKEVARAGYELGHMVLFMGKQDKAGYFEEIPQEHKENIDFSFMNCSDEERVDAYRHMTIYVGNSRDDIEEGPLGLLEAMACGVPVVTTRAGIAAEIIKDGENGLLVNFEDYEDLKAKIKRLMGDAELREKLRSRAWDTVKVFTEERMAWEYERAYWDVYRKGRPLVSVIIPATSERREQVERILIALAQSTHRYVEPIVVWDEKAPHDTIEASVKQYSTGNDGYGLAMARNIGAINAQGEYLMFCDSRLLPEPDAIENFLAAAAEADEGDKIWMFGEKGGGKREFVENFSMIRKKDYVLAGMSNERITAYGGMSQELRDRFRQQGFLFGYIPTARCTQMTKARKTNARRADIVAMKTLLHKMGL